MGVAPHVHGLLLTPQELSIGVPPQLPLYEVKGEGHQLHTHTHTHMHMSWNVCRCVHTLYQVIREGHQLHIDTHTDTQKHTHVSNTCLCTNSVPGQREGHQQQTHRHEDRQTDTDTHTCTHISMCMYRRCQMQCTRWPITICSGNSCCSQELQAWCIN